MLSPIPISLWLIAFALLMDFNISNFITCRFTSYSWLLVLLLNNNNILTLETSYVRLVHNLRAFFLPYFNVVYVFLQEKYKNETDDWAWWLSLLQCTWDLIASGLIYYLHEAVSTRIVTLVTFYFALTDSPTSSLNVAIECTSDVILIFHWPGLN